MSRPACKCGDSRFLTDSFIYAWCEWCAS